MSDPKPFRPAWRAVDHVPADLPTVYLLAHVEHLESQIAKLARMVADNAGIPASE